MTRPDPRVVAKLPLAPHSLPERFVSITSAFGLTIAATFSLGLALPPQTVAQLPSDSGAQVERVADGIFAIVHRDATRDWPSRATDWPHGNTGVIVGEDGILVVDATFYPGRARADIALIRRLSDRPVRYLVNTHWHGDHTHGNAVYRAAFPGIHIVSQRANRDFIAVNQERLRSLATRPGFGYRAALADLEATLARGADSAGRPFTAAERDGLTEAVAERRVEVAELAAVQVSPPDLLFDDTLTILLGRRRAQLRNWGRANSPQDVTVYVPGERTLFTGDILVHPVPYTMYSYPTLWIAVLDGVERLSPVALVPGHGPVFRDLGYLRDVRALFVSATTQAEAMMRQGLSWSEAQSRFQLDSMRARFVRDNDPTAVAFWDYSVLDALLERSWACVQGMRC